MIFSDFRLALSQFFDRRFLRVLLLGVGLSIALLVGFSAIILWLIDSGTDTLTLPGGHEVEWIGDLFVIGSFLVLLVISMVLMIPVASAVTSLFLDDVAHAVEEEHYPHLPPVGRVTFWAGLRDTLNFLGLMLFANFCALLLIAVLPFATLPIFYGLNGFLLGREYFQIIAMRRLGREKAKELRAANSGQIWLAGCLMAIPLSIPLINLVIPVLGAATFTHLFHRLNRS